MGQYLANRHAPTECRIRSGWNQEDIMNRSLTLTTAVLLLLLGLIACFVAAPTVAAVGDDEIVAFNTQSHKYHCLTCEWAVKCTRNCINIKTSEAIARGGVPCKVCGGSCKTGSRDAATTSLQAHYGGAVQGVVLPDRIGPWRQE